MNDRTTRALRALGHQTKHDTAKRLERVYDRLNSMGETEIAEEVGVCADQVENAAAILSEGATLAEIHS